MAAPSLPKRVPHGAGHGRPWLAQAQQALNLYIIHEREHIEIYGGAKAATSRLYHDY